MAHQTLKIKERKRNRENGATDVHNVVGTNSKEEKKSNALKKNLEKPGPTFFKFQSMCRNRHTLRQKEGKSFMQYLIIFCTGTVLLEFN